MLEEILTELFSIPIGLKPTVKVGDAQLYGSASLDKNYKKSIAKSETASFASDQISSLVDRGKINLCYLNKGIVRVLMWKVLVVHPFKSVLAFFSTKTNKVYIVIDNNISYLGHISNTLVGSLTIHECCHMASYSDSTSFFNLFSQELTNFYSNYFKSVFKLDIISQKDVRDFAFDLIKSETQKDRRTKVLDIVDKFLDSLKKDFKGKSKEFDKLRDRYIIVCKAILGTWDAQAYRDIMNSREIIIPFYRTYKSTFGLRTRHILHCQEVVTASEVVCVYSQIAPSDKILSMFSLIK